MKVKYLWIVALLSLTFYGCDDNTGSLGLGMFPGSDQTINGRLATFEMNTKSAKAENTFARTSVGYLGKFTDQTFGYYEAGFLTEFNCNKGFHFPTKFDPNSEADRKNPEAVMMDLYRAEIVLGYRSYFGDSLTASRLSIYRLDKMLDKESAYYTDIIPEDFYNKNNPNTLLGRKAYTAVDLSVRDSIRNLSSYYPNVTITLPLSIGEEILAASRKADSEGVDFAIPFRELFKGIYVKNDYGDGTILYVDKIELNIVYNMVVRDSIGSVLKKYNSEVDSIAYGYRTFAATKEIIQANSFRNDEGKLEEKVNEKGCTYLKTPAGIYTQAKLPLIAPKGAEQKGILDSLGNDTLNMIKLTFTNYNQPINSGKYNMSAPENILLIREKERDSFFKENKVNDDITSYLAQHDGNQYVFNNIARLIKTCRAERDAAVLALQNEGMIEDVLGIDGNPVTTIEAWETATQWDKIVILPVSITTDTNQSSGIKTVTSVLNDLKPGYAKLKGGEEGGALTLDVIYTSFNKD